MKHRKRAASRDKTSVVDEAQGRIAQDGNLAEDTRRHILEFMSYLQVEGLKPDSIAGYATTLRRLASFCPGNEFLYLEREDVQEVILALQRKGYRTSTMNLFRTRFLRFQRWLRQELGYPEDYPDFGVSGERLDPGERPVEFRGIRTAWARARPARASRRCSPCARASIVFRDAPSRVSCRTSSAWTSRWGR